MDGMIRVESRVTFSPRWISGQMMVFLPMDHIPWMPHLTVTRSGARQPRKQDWSPRERSEPEGREI